MDYPPKGLQNNTFGDALDMITEVTSEFAKEFVIRVQLNSDRRSTIRPIIIMYRRAEQDSDTNVAQPADGIEVQTKVKLVDDVASIAPESTFELERSFGRQGIDAGQLLRKLLEMLATEPCGPSSAKVTRANFHKQLAGPIRIGLELQTKQIRHS